MLIYIAHRRKKTSNALDTLVLTWLLTILLGQPVSLDSYTVCTKNIFVKRLLQKLTDLNEYIRHYNRDRADFRCPTKNLSLKNVSIYGCNNCCDCVDRVRRVRVRSVRSRLAMQSRWQVVRGRAKRRSWRISSTSARELHRRTTIRWEWVTCLTVCLSDCLSVCLSVCLFDCLWLSVCLSVCFCLSVCPSVRK